MWLFFWILLFIHGCFLNRNYNLEPVENDATLEYKKFVCIDFLISSNSATLGFITQSGTKVDVKLVNNFIFINIIKFYS